MIEQLIVQKKGGPYGLKLIQKHMIYKVWKPNGHWSVTEIQVVHDRWRAISSVKRGYTRNFLTKEKAFLYIRKQKLLKEEW